MTTPEVHVRPRPLLPFPFGPVAAPGVAVFRGDAWLAGWSLVETTGLAGAALTLFDGGDANGVPLAVINLGAGESTRDFFGGHMLTARSGLFVAVTSGTVQGVLYLADK